MLPERGRSEPGTARSRWADQSPENKRSEARGSPRSRPGPARAARPEPAGLSDRLESPEQGGDQGQDPRPGSARRLLNRTQSDREEPTPAQRLQQRVQPECR
ncbi:unnamed protein product [Caretta caretta]